MTKLLFFFLLLILVSCSDRTSESNNAKTITGNFSISVVDTITFDIKNNYPSGSLLLDSINTGIWSFSSSRNTIIKNDSNNLIIEVTGFEANLQYSSKAFFELTNFLHRINLTTKSIELQGLKYPEESPFRKQLYWTGAFPNIVKSKDKYIVVYQLNPKIYLYDSSMEMIQEFDFISKNFPETNRGGPFPSPQQENAALITRKLNGFSLGFKSIAS